jgi:2-polyprenyl-3-methyl-5-hydroxy-6-metoxy-1,4-benzoquinol methylase
VQKTEIEKKLLYGGDTLKYYNRTNCRLCSSTKLELMIKFAPTPPADSYVTEEFKSIEQELIPLDLYFCNDCNHTQLGHILDEKEIYLNYIYETVSTLGLGDHFKECAEEIMSVYQPEVGGLVLDIGSNDGILLKHFQDLGMTVLGIDPMPGIAEKATANGIKTLPLFFPQDVNKPFIEEHSKPAVICSNNLVADTDDLDSFISKIKELMDDNTIFFFESFYFYSQIKNHNWDFTYHEHFSYFTIAPLKTFFARHGLEIIDVKLNPTKGGSIRVVLQLIGGKRKVDQSVRDLSTEETNFGMNRKEVFASYRKRIDDGANEFKLLMTKLKSEGKQIVGYGASATSTTLIYNYNLQDCLDYLVDDFQSKQGLYSPGCHLPVYDPKVIYTDNPDYIIILAWRYHEKIIDKHQDFLKKGGKFIIPLPKLKIMSSE